VDAELRVDVVEVGSNGRGRDPEPARDLYVGQPLADQCQDFALTNGELLAAETWAFRLCEAPPPCVLLELEEVREEQVDDRSIRAPKSSSPRSKTKLRATPPRIGRKSFITYSTPSGRQTCA